jgi:hypothetical protein
VASTAIRWPELDEEALDPRILNEMEPADPPDDEDQDDDESASVLPDLGPDEDDE